MLSYHHVLWPQFYPVFLYSFGENKRCYLMHKFRKYMTQNLYCLYKFCIAMGRRGSGGRVGRGGHGGRVLFLVWGWCGLTRGGVFVRGMEELPEVVAELEAGVGGMADT